MKPNFPEKNLAVNSLINFRKPGNIYEFTTYFEYKDPNQKGFLEHKVTFAADLFEDMNKEIHQIIHTTNEQTKILFFEELKNNIKKFNLLDTSKELFQAIVDKWNEKRYLEFLEKVKEAEVEFFAMENRKKYQHLEKYEGTVFNLPTLRSVKSVLTNYNIYCINEKPDQINPAYLDHFLDILRGLTDKFKMAYENELRLYEEGKVLQAKKDDTFYDKLLIGLKNNKPAAVIGFIFLLYVGITQFIASTKENRDNIWGKDGLIGGDSTSRVTKETVYVKLRDTVFVDSARKTIPLKKK